MFHLKVEILEENFDNLLDELQRIHKELTRHKEDDEEQRSRWYGVRKIRGKYTLLKPSPEEIDLAFSGKTYRKDDEI